VFAALFVWLNLVTGAGAGRAKDALAYSPMPYVLDGPRVAIDSEIDWLERRLHPHLDKLRHFRELADLANSTFWAAQYDQCFEALGLIEQEFGQSLWHIEARIALEQHVHGLEAQKSYVSSVRKKYNAGVPAYIAHFTSIRNEDRSTIRLFRADAVRRISNTKLPEAAKIYLKYKIADEIDYTESTLSCILRAEQSQSVVDIYETAIALFQGLVKVGRSERYSAAITRAARQWAPINDFRLTKLLLGLGELDVGDMAIRQSGAVDLLISGDAGRALRAARQSVHVDPTDPWSGIELAFAQSFHAHV
jgi:hypothetical protein